MSYIILFCLLLTLLLIYLKFVKIDIFQPYIIILVSYIICLFFCFLNKNNWQNYKLSYKSVYYVFIIFTFMFVFAYISYKLAINSKKNLCFKNDIIDIPIHFTKKHYIFLITIIVLMTISIFIDRFFGAIRNGYKDSIYNIGKLSRYIYNISLFSNYKMLHINTYFNYLLIGFFSMSIYSIIKNIYIYKEKLMHNIDNLCILIITSFNILMSGQRGNIFFGVSISIGVFSFMFNIKKHKKIEYFVLIKKLFLLFVGFFIFWTITVYLLNNTFNILNAINDFMTYLSGAIITFDEYINGRVSIIKPDVFGGRLFAHIYSYLNRLHLSNINIMGTWISTSDSIVGINVYSGFFNSYEAFGLLGCAFYWSIIIFVFTYFYNILLKKGSSNLLRIIYSYFSMPLYLISFSDNFSARFISTTPIYIFVFFYITYVLYFKLLKNEE